MPTSKVTRNWFRIRYGLTYEQVLEMFERQNGICPICKSQMNLDSTRTQHRAVIDHDPEIRSKARRYGRYNSRMKLASVRGLICHKCNVGIGMLGGIDALVNAVVYLNLFNNGGTVNERPYQAAIW